MPKLRVSETCDVHSKWHGKTDILNCECGFVTLWFRLLCFFSVSLFFSVHEIPFLMLASLHRLFLVDPHLSESGFSIAHYNEPQLFVIFPFFCCTLAVAVVSMQILHLKYFELKKRTRNDDLSGVRHLMHSQRTNNP